jgi:hypothetical protein
MLAVRVPAAGSLQRGRQPVFDDPTCLPSRVTNERVASNCSRTRSRQLRLDRRHARFAGLPYPIAIPSSGRGWP